MMGWRPSVAIAALACVVMISTGQLLFKMVAARLAADAISVGAVRLFLVAMAIYGIATIAWIFVLRYVPLSNAYPLMAMSFILVPLGSRIVFGETLAPLYWAGVALLVAGVFLIGRSIPQG
jgi:drug/metabolite transporter (DMT)-like permease